MDVVAALDELIVCLIGVDGLVAVGASDVLQKVFLKLLAEGFDVALGVFTELLHHALMTIAREVALEAVFVSALLLAHLAVPPGTCLIHAQNTRPLPPNEKEGKKGKVSVDALSAPGLCNACSVHANGYLSERKERRT